MGLRVCFYILLVVNTVGRGKYFNVTVGLHKLLERLSSHQQSFSILPLIVMSKHLVHSLTSKTFAVQFCPQILCWTMLLSNNIPNNTGNHHPSPGCSTEHCEGRVWIFFSNVNRISQWGTISKLGMGKYEKGLICNQLGYVDYTDYDPIVDDLPEPSPPVWLTEIACEHNSSNILQCNYTHCTDDSECSNHTNDLIITCGKYNHA